MLHKKLHSII